MNNKEKIKYVKEHFLSEALASIDQHGRYWNSSISREFASTLDKLITKKKKKILMREIAPIWEHVYYYHHDSELIVKIAIERAKIMEQPYIYSDLPV
ncbi:hypothetical protein [Aeromonas veronii]|uniref:hypothetical protein n=1 Tax=Aeromonas veronii TaxID=654 RepID=UPI0024166F1D|nr:hypothetical protein [Aeromonas veronii]WFO49761.1 hypothetical protein L1O00_12005 [Aeromonas veronii]